MFGGLECRRDTIRGSVPTTFSGGEPVLCPSLDDLLLGPTQGVRATPRPTMIRASARCYFCEHICSFVAIDALMARCPVDLHVVLGGAVQELGGEFVDEAARYHGGVVNGNSRS